MQFVLIFVAAELDSCFSSQPSVDNRLAAFLLIFFTELAVLFKNIKPKMTKWIIPPFLQNIELENQKDFNPAVQKMRKNQVNPLLCC